MNIKAHSNDMRRNIWSRSSSTTHLPRCLRRGWCPTGSLLEAVRAFEEDTFVQNVLGEDLSAKYVMAKKNEYQQFREYVTGWELEKYLHKI